MSIIAGMNYDESLHYMSGLIRFGWKLDLERITALCARLGNPQDRYAVLHVAGTKGKGSTTALAAGILRAAGFRVGAYFSPYVYDVRERVQINGEMIPQADFARLVSEIRPHIEAVAQTDLGQTTEFELKTLVAFSYFAEQQVNFACIEVGIGGRLDATNVVRPAVTVITNIGLDHTQILGETYGAIAGEKAGILKTGVPCFTATDNAEALSVIRRRARECNVPLTRVLPAPDAEVENAVSERSQAPDDTENLAEGSEAEESPVTWRVESAYPHTSTVTIQTPAHIYPDCAMAMGGVYQRANAACAVGAVEAALAAQGRELPLSAVREGLARTALPGRLSIVRLPNGPIVVMDGAHNALAAESLAGPVAALQVQENTPHLRLVVGMVGGHDPAGVLAPFAPRAISIYVSAPDWKRALPAAELADAARRFNPNIQEYASVAAAVRAALEDAGPDDLVLVTGSFYTVGEVRPDLLLSLTLP